MDLYANPPLSVVEFSVETQQLQIDAPLSPIGSPPNTPSRSKSSNFEAGETSEVNKSFNTIDSSFNGSSTYFRFADMSREQEDVPMDEQLHYDTDQATLQDDIDDDLDGPDDEMLGRLDNAARNHSRSQTPVPSLARRTTLQESTSPGSVPPFHKSPIVSSSNIQMPNSAGEPTLRKRNSVRDRIQQYEQPTPTSDKAATSPQTGMKTPDKELLSPPKLLLKRTGWESNGSPATVKKSHAVLSPLSTRSSENTSNPSPGHFHSRTGSDIPEDERRDMMKAAAAAARLDKQLSMGKPHEKQSLPTSLAASNHKMRRSSGTKVTGRTSSTNTNTSTTNTTTRDKHPMTTPKDEVDPKVVSGLRLDETSPRRPAPRRLQYDGDAVVYDDTPEEYQKSRRVKAEILITPDEAEQGRDESNAVSKNGSKQLGTKTRAGDPRLSSINVLSPSSGPAIEVELDLSDSSLGIPSLDSPSLTELWDFKTQELIMVQSFDSSVGIAKGDITLSVLNELNDMSPAASCPSRVRAAIWRCRRARMGTGAFPSSMGTEQVQPVNEDVRSMHDASLNFLLADDLGPAIEIYKDIVSAYQLYLERKSDDELKIEKSIGAAQHNLGILNLLNGDYKKALSCFTDAARSRRASLVRGHPDRTASMVKMATCYFALNQLQNSHKLFEEALAISEISCTTLEDQMQLAEILNNLGYLAYTRGHLLEESKVFFDQCMDVQIESLSESLYESSQVMNQSLSLNLSIVRANLGFVQMVSKSVSSAIKSLENALMEQQVLLKGVNDTTIATMEHLAVVNLFGSMNTRASNMFERILDMLEKEYGKEHRRYRIAINRINTVRKKVGDGADFEEVVKELQKTAFEPRTGSSSRKAKPPMDPSSKSRSPKPWALELKKKQAH
eukprot:scaffold3720_cov141-Cylindrotheca_fusiformis.AAC.13